MGFNTGIKANSINLGCLSSMPAVDGVESRVVFLENFNTTMKYSFKK